MIYGTNRIYLESIAACHSVAVAAGDFDFGIQRIYGSVEEIVLTLTLDQMQFIFDTMFPIIEATALIASGFIAVVIITAALPKMFK